MSHLLSLYLPDYSTPLTRWEKKVALTIVELLKSGEADELDLEVEDGCDGEDDPDFEPENDSLYDLPTPANPGLVRFSSDTFATLDQVRFPPYSVFLSFSVISF